MSPPLERLQAYAPSPSLVSLSIGIVGICKLGSVFVSFSVSESRRHRHIVRIVDVSRASKEDAETEAETEADAY